MKPTCKDTEYKEKNKKAPCHSVAANYTLELLKSKLIKLKLSFVK